MRRPGGQHQPSILPNRALCAGGAALLVYHSFVLTRTCLGPRLFAALADARDYKFMVIIMRLTSRMLFNKGYRLILPGWRSFATIYAAGHGGRANNLEP